MLGTNNSPTLHFQQHAAFDWDDTVQRWKLTSRHSWQIQHRRARPGRCRSRSSLGASCCSWPWWRGRWWTHLGHKHSDMLEKQFAGRLFWELRCLAVPALTTLVAAGSKEHLEVVFAVFPAFELTKEFRRGKQYKSDARTAQDFNWENKFFGVTGRVRGNVIISVSCLITQRGN